jgi:Inner membrane protein YgaP-like, transmembrane domain
MSSAEEAKAALWSRTIASLAVDAGKSTGLHGAHIRKEPDMNIDRAVLAFAGMMVLASLALAWLVSPYWLLFTAFIGLNMLQAAFTGFCPAAMIFRKLGLRGGRAFAGKVDA